MKIIKWFNFSRCSILIVIICVSNSINAQYCPQIQLQVLTVAPAGLQRYGFSEFYNISTPPKMYLVDTTNNSEAYSDSWDYDTGIDIYGNYAVETGHNINNLFIHGTSTINALSGAAVNNYSGTRLSRLESQ